MAEIKIEELDDLLAEIEKTGEKGVAFAPFFIGKIGPLEADVMLVGAKKTDKGFEKVAEEPKMYVKVTKTDESYKGSTDAEVMPGWYVVSKATATKGAADTAWTAGSLSVNKVREDGSVEEKASQPIHVYEETIFESVKSALKFISTKTKQNVGGRKMKKIEESIVIDGKRLIELSDIALTDKVNEIVADCKKEQQKAQEKTDSLTTTGIVKDQNGKIVGNIVRDQDGEVVRTKVVAGENQYHRLAKEFEGKYKDVDIETLMLNEEYLSDLKKVQDARRIYEKNQKLLNEAKSEYDKAEQKMTVAIAVQEIRHLSKENEGLQEKLSKKPDKERTAELKKKIADNNEKIKVNRALIAQAVEMFSEFVSVKKKQPKATAEPVEVQDVAPIETKPEAMEPEAEEVKPEEAEVVEEEGLVVIDRAWVIKQKRQKWETKALNAQKQIDAKQAENKQLEEQKVEKKAKIAEIKKEIVNGRFYLGKDVYAPNQNFDGTRDRTPEIENQERKIETIDSMIAENQKAVKDFEQEKVVAEAVVKLIDIVAEIEKRQRFLFYIEQITDKNEDTLSEKKGNEDSLYRLTGTDDGTADRGEFAKYANVIRRELKNGAGEDLLSVEEKRKAAEKDKEDARLKKEAEKEAAAENNRLRTELVMEAYQTYYAEVRKVNGDAELSQERKESYREAALKSLERYLILILDFYGKPTREDAKTEINKKAYKELKQEDARIAKEIKDANKADKGRAK